LHFAPNRVVVAFCCVLLCSASAFCEERPEWQRGSSGFRGILKDVHFFNARRGIAVGERGAILSTTDGGAEWQAVASPTAEMLYAVDFPTPTTGYACGKGVVLKTADGGTTWSRLPSPTDLDILSDVRFTDESHGLMVGDVGAIFLTGNGGATWQKVVGPVTHWLHRIEVVDDSTFLVAGSRGTILRSADAGKFPAGSFGVWCNGTFTIKVPGIKAVKPPRVIGARHEDGEASKDQPPPSYTTNYAGGVLTISIKDKDPAAHPMLVFEPQDKSD